jgi:dTDP-4-amino-4,6-dideoxy-D-galactose acyltransferase
VAGKLPCEYLAFDSELFGFPIARAQVSHLCTKTEVAEIFDWCASNEIRCLYYLANIDDRETIRLLENNGFQWVDNRVTFARRVGSDIVGVQGTRLVTPEDIEELSRIARQSFDTSRFFFDENFPRDRCTELYDRWIRNSCTGGFAQATVVPERDGKPCAFVTCHVLKDGTGNIGLVAVAPEAKGHGLGRKAVMGAMGWFARNGVVVVSVVAPVRAIAAHNLYEACGFRIQSIQLWYHRWFY